MVFKQDLNWWFFALAGMVLSIYLTSRFGAEARAGLIVNFVLILAVIIGIGHWKYYKKYENDVILALKEEKQHQNAVALDALPKPLCVTSQLAASWSSPFPTMSKLNSLERWPMEMEVLFPLSPSNMIFLPIQKIVFMRGNIKGLTVPGYHKWVEGKGIMDVSIMGWIPVVHYEGAMMNQADAVTLLNDICLFAPHVLRKAAFYL